MTIEKTSLKIMGSFFMAALLLFSSCKKDSNAFKESSDSDQNHKNAMLYAKEINDYTLADMQTYTAETQQLVFSELTPDNQARLVKERIDFAINQETDPSLVAKLNGLKAMATPALYALDRDPALAESLAQYVESIITSFGYDKMKSITTTWGGTGTVTPAGMVGGIGPSDCSCGTSDDWCSGIGKCGGSDNCIHLSWGCGTLFTAKCDGICGLGTSASVEQGHMHGGRWYTGW